MGIEKILDEYIFSNVGQFRAIAGSLGYKESYDRGKLTFTNGREESTFSLEEIRAHTGRGETPGRQASMERLCQFLDKEKAVPGDEALSAKGVSICDWGDLKGDNKDRFTVIDHENKISYTGKELYDYAAENGYLLDGKGTRLEKGVLSGMTSVKGKPAKVRLTENGVSVFYRKESLVIPDKILGHRLSQREKDALIAGNIVPVRGDKGDFLLQVDRDLNAVIIRSHKELSIPSEIGGYELTLADKYLLANGHSIDNKLLKTEEGYILANVRLTQDKKGYEISDIQALPETKARELSRERVNTPGNDYVNGHLMRMRADGHIIPGEMGDKRYERLIKEHFLPEYEAFRSWGADPDPDKDFPYAAEGRVRLKAGEMLEREGLLPKGTSEKELAEEGWNVQGLREESLEREMAIGSGGRDLEAELMDAVKRRDLDKIASLHGEGYSPSAEIIKTLGKDPGLSVAERERVLTLFGEEPPMSKGPGQLTERGRPGGIEDLDPFWKELEDQWFPEDKTFWEKEQPQEEQKQDQSMDKAGDPVVAKGDVPGQDEAFRSAVEKGDFSRIAELGEQGYKPPKELMESLSATAPEANIIAAGKILGLKAKSNTLGDVRLARKEQPEASLNRPVAQTINNMFNNM